MGTLEAYKKCTKAYLLKRHSPSYSFCIFVSEIQMLSVISYLCRAVIEAHLVAHLLTQPDPHLMGHPLGYSDGCNPPGLSHTNPAIPAKTWKQTQTCWRRGIDPTHMPFSSSSMVMYLTSHNLPALYKYWGSWVVFPLPVSPVTIRKVFSFTAWMSLSLSW